MRKQPESNKNQLCAAKVLGWRVTLAYDGTDFFGWQAQPGLSTIQGRLAEAIAHVTGESVLPQGSGRTDAGVHAAAQVASFPLRAPIPPANLMRALNRALPASIRVLEAIHAPPGFHARHDALAKTYEYRIFRGEPCPPWLTRYVYALPWPLDVDAMRRAQNAVLGTHDFSSFAATDPDRSARMAENCVVHNVRTIYSAEWKQDGDLLVYRVRGDGFLHHMVRNLAGLGLAVGRGQIAPEAVHRILAARQRSTAAATAPARGLWLVSVEYTPC